MALVQAIYTLTNLKQNHIFQLKCDLVILICVLALQLYITTLFSIVAIVLELWTSYPINVLAEE